MRRVTLTLMAIAIFAGAAFSQNVRYKIKLDDPNDVANLVIHLDPMYMDLGWANMNFGYGIRADLMLGRIMDISFAYRKPYFDLTYNDAKDYEYNGETVFMPKKGYTSFTYMEPTVRLHIRDKVKASSHRLVLEQSTTTSGNYRTTTSKYIDVPGSKRKIFSVEGSMIWMSMPVSWQNGLQDVKPEDFKFVEKGNESNQITTLANNDGSMYQMVAIAGGLSFQGISNLKALTDNYGVKYSTQWTNFYFDLMYAPVMRYQNVENSEGKEFKVEVSNMKRTGWRIGWSVKNTKGIAFSLDNSLGVRPGYVGEGGISSQRIFYNMTLGIGIANKAKLKK